MRTESSPAAHCQRYRQVDPRRNIAGPKILEQLHLPEIDRRRETHQILHRTVVEDRRKAERTPPKQ
jgi:hypothetical protein